MFMATNNLSETFSRSTKIYIKLSLITKSSFLNLWHTLHDATQYFVFIQFEKSVSPLLTTYCTFIKTYFDGLYGLQFFDYNTCRYYRYVKKSKFKAYGIFTSYCLGWFVFKNKKSFKTRRFLNFQLAAIL